MDDNIDRATLRERIGAIMGRDHLTKADFARRCGVTPETLRAFLLGKLPSYKLMKNMARELGLSADEASRIFFAADLRNT